MDKFQFLILSHNLSETKSKHVMKKLLNLEIEWMNHELSYRKKFASSFLHILKSLASRNSYMRIILACFDTKFSNSFTRLEFQVSKKLKTYKKYQF